MRVRSWRLTSLFPLAMALLMSTATPVDAQPSQRQIHDGIEEAVILAEAMPDAFGGVWLSDTGAVFAFTHRATETQIADVMGLVKAGISVTTIRVDWSEAELRKAQDMISDAMRTQDPPFVTRVGVELQQNAVVIGLTPEYFVVCQAGLVARYGSVRLLFEADGPGELDADSSPVTASVPPSLPLPPDRLAHPSPSPAASLASPAAW